jgi:hypothetical protein
VAAASLIVEKGLPTFSPVENLLAADSQEILLQMAAAGRAAGACDAPYLGQKQNPVSPVRNPLLASLLVKQTILF